MGRSWLSLHGGPAQQRATQQIGRQWQLRRKWPLRRILMMMRMGVSVRVRVMSLVSGRVGVSMMVINWRRRLRRGRRLAN